MDRQGLPSADSCANSVAPGGTAELFSSNPEDLVCVCVSLFYVIDTGSIGSRARHHVMGWGLPIVWTVERIIEETFESGEGGGPMRRSRSPSRGGEVGNLSKMGSTKTR